MFQFTLILLQANRGSDDDSDSDSLDDDAEETALESYQTPLDDDNSPIDEYIIFKHVFSSKFTVKSTRNEELQMPVA